MISMASQCGAFSFMKKLCRKGMDGFTIVEKATLA